MADALGYFFFIYVFALFLLAIRAMYLNSKLINYIQQNYPEKAREFGCQRGGLGNNFRFNKALRKEHKISDPHFIRLENQAKNTQTWMIVAFLLLLAFFLISILVGSLL